MLSGKLIMEGKLICCQLELMVDQMVYEDCASQKPSAEEVLSVLVCVVIRFFAKLA